MSFWMSVSRRIKGTAETTVEELRTRPRRAFALLMCNLACRYMVSVHNAPNKQSMNESSSPGRPGVLSNEQESHLKG